MNLIPHYLIDIIHKTVKPSHLEKLQIMKNISKQMLQVISIFQQNKANHSFLHPFRLGEKDFQNILLTGGLGHE